MLWFLRGLRRGIVTTRYPAGTREPWTDTLPSAPAFRPALLTVELADRLQATCPSGALQRERDQLSVDLAACTGCGRCVAVGGDTVIASGEFLLAARRRSDLIKRVPIAAELPTDRRYRR
jgi:ferredoxin